MKREIERGDQGGPMVVVVERRWCLRRASLARSGKSEVRAEGTVSASFPVN